MTLLVETLSGDLKMTVFSELAVDLDERLIQKRQLDHRRGDLLVWQRTLEVSNSGPMSDLVGLMVHPLQCLDSGLEYLFPLLQIQAVLEQKLLDSVDPCDGMETICSLCSEPGRFLKNPAVSDWEQHTYRMNAV